MHTLFLGFIGKQSALHSHAVLTSLLECSCCIIFADGGSSLQASFTVPTMLVFFLRLFCQFPGCENVICRHISSFSPI